MRAKTNICFEFQHSATFLTSATSFLLQQDSLRDGTDLIRDRRFCEKDTRGIESSIFEGDCSTLKAMLCCIKSVQRNLRLFIAIIFASSSSLNSNTIEYIVWNSACVSRVASKSYIGRSDDLRRKNREEL